ncbi:MAG: hypothetical protein IJI68_00645 [Eggerthellaceae bacterium]|nr:hypothetical protein [Eggerthellaceae bacterium]
MNNLQRIIENDMRAAMHMAVELCERGDFDSVNEALRWLMQERDDVATPSGGECVPHGEWERVSQTQEVRHVFCECGRELGMDRRDSFPFERTQLFAMPNYCQECGRKIRKAVEHG